MPRPDDNPDVKTSKALAYILRHGAEKEGLQMRSDGYLKLNDVLARPKLRGVDTAMVLRLVAENAKQRFDLFYGIDPSPPRPKSKKGQGKGKKQTLGTGSGAASGTTDVAAPTGSSSSRMNLSLSEPNTTSLPSEGSSSRTESIPEASTESSVSADLPLISVPETDPSRGEWFIRATQGHSIQLESVSHLVPVLDDEDGRARAGVCVHGTRWELWNVLRDTGLSRMGRTHIHLAPALSDHRILPRPNSTLRIYLDVTALLSANIPLYTSSNGVVLTPGDEHGVVDKKYWKMAERKVDGEWVVVLQDGEEKP